jgi:hypothetical protein
MECNRQLSSEGRILSARAETSHAFMRTHSRIVCTLRMPRAYSSSCSDTIQFASHESVLEAESCEASLARWCRSILSPLILPGE